MKAKSITKISLFLKSDFRKVKSLLESKLKKMVLISGKNDHLVATLGQFHQHFTRKFLYESAFFAKTKLEKSCTKHFRTKNACVKCWWNWPLVLYVLLQFIFCRRESRKNSRPSESVRSNFYYYLEYFFPRNFLKFLIFP